MFEIGLVSRWNTPAVQIIGPYYDREYCLQQMEEYNKSGKIPHHSWMWARWGEIPRAAGCLVSEPT